MRCTICDQASNVHYTHLLAMYNNFLVYMLQAHHINSNQNGTLPSLSIKGALQNACKA